MIEAITTIDTSLVDKNGGSSKFAVIIDHEKQQLVVKQYTRMIHLVNTLVGAGRYTIHRIYLREPKIEELIKMQFELF